MSLSLVMVGPATAQAGEVWVDDDAPDDPGPGDPLVSDPLEDGSVDHPFDEIHEGIDVVESPGTVHVLAGTYNELITLKDGVEVLGAGQDVTTINGGGSGTVVTSTGDIPATKLGGFTITGGNASFGGGMHNESSSPTVSNCTFSGNWAAAGGGMDNNISSSPTLTNCTFSGNSAGSGGGMYNRNSSSPTLTSCTFSGNSATSCGGAMENYSLASPTLTNCTFFNNSASSGGVMYSYNSSPTLTNCTFSGNSATSSGGAMYNEQNSMVTVTNCILWGNTAPTGGEIYNVSSTPTVTYCDVQGEPVYTGDGNINTDPLFADAAGDDYHLKMGSPCIDAGNNSAPDIPAADFEGDPRILDGDNDMTATVDMGVDEAYYLAPPQVWVDDSWNSQTDVNDFNSSLIWQYDAFATIQEGIDAVASPGTVHVLAGTYNELITLKNGVEVLGAGQEVTTINGTGTGSVVTASGVDSTTKLDGFTITGGSTDYGAGMYNVTSSPTVTNCTFSGNSANYEGGGMRNYNSSPTVTNCTFSGNSAVSGGGMHNDTSSPTVSNCNFSDNSSSQNGAGMFNIIYSSPVVTNCTFSGNTTNSYFFGGGMYNAYYSSPAVTNCTFSGNSAPWGGGGMYNTSSSSPAVTNSILWGNTNGEITNYDASIPVVTYSDVQGGYTGGTNIDANPLFVDAAGDDYHLTAGSPCIDAGNNTAPAIPATDFEGQQRIVDGDGDATDTVDMGADEYLPRLEVWVDDGWTSQADVNLFDPSLSWQYDAFATIQEGIDVVASPGTVHVLAGTYNELITLKDGVEVLGAGQDVTTINGGGAGTVVTADGVTSATKLDGFTITGGNATNGGGMSNNNASLTVTNCTFSGSTASWYGGGMYNVESSPTVTNCTFSGNLAAWGGGMCNEASSPTVTNCTFYGNSASSRGGGMANLSSSPTVTNCILWGDIAPDDSEEFHSAPYPVLTYCDVQGGYTGTGNIDSDPLFADADGADNIVGTLDDDLHITAGSPCIDTGFNDAATAAGLITDFEGDPRIMDGNGDATATVDMGVDELLPCVSLDFPYDTVDEGARFSIQVAVDHVVNFDSADYELHFDAAVIQLDSVGQGLIDGTTIPVLYNELSPPSPGDWQISHNVPDTPGVTGGGYFAVLNFTVIGLDTSTCTISFYNGTVSDNTATAIICNWTGTGTLTIDLLEVTAISVVGEPVVTSEGYVVPPQAGGCTTETNFTMTPTVSGGTGAGTYTYAWTFDTGGSGNTTASAPIDVTYGSSGAKTVDLRVTDALSSTSEGHEVSGSATVYDTLVAGYNGDTGTFGHPQEGMVKWSATLWVSTTSYPSTVTFYSSTSTGGKVTYTYSWDFNNDATEDSASANPAAFDFATFPGTDSDFQGARYINVLTVYDSLTASDDETKPDYITIYAAGDVNGDLTFNASDITAIERIVAGIDPQTLNSDVNDDGVVNVLDITAAELAAA